MVLKQFWRGLNNRLKICIYGDITDYKIFITDNLFNVRPKVKRKQEVKNIPKQLKTETIDNAKIILNKKHDVYVFQAEYL